MKVKLNRVFINTTDKNGQPLINKKGEPYTMATIEFDVAGNTQRASMYIGGKFGKKDLEVIETWKEGQEVEVVLEANGRYTNFRLPSRADALEETVREHGTRISKLEEWAKKVSKGSF